MSLPPTINSPLFKSAFLADSNTYLTISTGDQRYLKLGGVEALSVLTVIGNLDVGSLSIGGSSVDLSYINGITAGVATASKALVSGSSRISLVP